MRGTDGLFPCSIPAALPLTRSLRRQESIKSSQQNNMAGLKLPGTISNSLRRADHGDFVPHLQTLSARMITQRTTAGALRMNSSGACFGDAGALRAAVPDKIP